MVERPIRHGTTVTVEGNYDQVIKYATAIKDGAAATEAVLSRFTRSGTHPAYQAMLEIGRAQKTIFAARYLRDRDLQREIEEGLNAVEAWNGANAMVCSGMDADMLDLSACRPSGAASWPGWGRLTAQNLARREPSRRYPDRLSRPSSLKAGVA